MFLPTAARWIAPPGLFTRRGSEVFFGHLFFKLVRSLAEKVSQPRLVAAVPR